jgi:hypothetical protein
MGENPLIVFNVQSAINASDIASHFLEISGRFAGDNFSGGKVVSDVFVHFHSLSFFSVSILYHKRDRLSTPFMKKFYLL